MKAYIKYIVVALCTALTIQFYDMYTELKTRTDEFNYELRMLVTNRTGKLLLVNAYPLYLGAKPIDYKSFQLTVRNKGYINIYLGKDFDVTKMYLILVCWEIESLSDDLREAKPYRIFVASNREYKLSPENYMLFSKITIDDDQEDD